MRRADSSGSRWSRPRRSPWRLGASAVALVDRGGSLEPGTPERLPISRDQFSFDSAGGGGRFGMAVRSPDGKRFLVARYDSQAVTEPVRLVRSWRRLVDQ